MDTGMDYDHRKSINLELTKSYTTSEDILETIESEVLYGFDYEMQFIAFKSESSDSS